MISSTKILAAAVVRRKIIHSALKFLKVQIKGVKEAPIILVTCIRGEIEVNEAS